MHPHTKFVTLIENCSVQSVVYDSAWFWVEVFLFCTGGKDWEAKFNRER